MSRGAAKLQTRLRAGGRAACIAGLAVLVAGCYGDQAALNPAGPQAAQISRLWWLFFSIGAVVYGLVLTALLLALVRGHRRARAERAAAAEPVLDPDPAGERRRALMVGGAVAITVVTLFTLLVIDFLTGRALHGLRSDDALTITVTGRQWWWEVRYEDPVPSRIVTTANEIHIPTGRPVLFRLQSNDVIHSFWVPNLHGKKDLIPGHPTTHWLLADREGVFFGQCAEFCGHQHAHMRFVVVAESPARFAAWQAAQLQPARPPTTARRRRGQEVFLSTTCVMCHTIQGTPARGRVGPDLTHVGSRLRLAAGTLPNSRGHLAGWITDPQHIKPGVRMPPNPLPPDDLHALLDYLSSLE